LIQDGNCEITVEGPENFKQLFPDTSIYYNGWTTKIQSQNCSARYSESEVLEIAISNGWKLAAATEDKDNEDKYLFFTRKIVL